MSDFLPGGFELSNTHRKYLGLDEVQPHWDRVPINDKCVLYFDGDIVRKMISYEYAGYLETDHYEMTSENRTVLLPRTKRGKRKKLNYSATRSFKDQGVYFACTKVVDYHLVIGNYTTQTSFYDGNGDGLPTIEEWLEKWVRETTDSNLAQLQQFKNSKRVHQKFAEGDFFTFKVGRNKWGFGRILLNIAERCKDPNFKRSNYGLSKLLGKALYIGVYRHLSDTPEADVDKLRQCGMLPVQPIFDNRFYYGEYRIIGHRELTPDEWEPPEIYSFGYDNPGATYLQYGLICRTRLRIPSDPYLKPKYPKGSKKDPSPKFSGDGIGFFIHHYYDLEKIITGNVDNDSLLREYDLRKSANREAKEAIFRSFGLDPDKSYAENLRIVNDASKLRVSASVLKGTFSYIRNIFRKKDQDDS